MFEQFVDDLSLFPQYLFFAYAAPSLIIQWKLKMREEMLPNCPKCRAHLLTLVDHGQPHAIRTIHRTRSSMFHPPTTLGLKVFRTQKPSKTILKKP